MASAERDHAAEEAEDIVVFFHERPIEPVDLVILAIGVIVPALCASDLVAGHKHRNALGEHENSCKVFNLPVAQGLDVGTIRLSLCSTIPAQVLVDAVAVALAVGLVVLIVVRDQVVEREAVVGSDEIDAVDRQFPAGLEDIGAAGNDISDLPHDRSSLDVTLVALDEAPEGIAETTVPFAPTIAGEVADFVESGGIPGLGDDFRIGQHLRQFDLPDDRRIDHGSAVLIAAQNDSLVETKTIDMHFLNPEFQGIYNELFCDGVIAVEGVATARIVHVVLPVLGRERVVNAIGKALEVDGRPAMITLGSVIEDDIENYTDPGLVQGLDHVAELIDMIADFGMHTVRVFRCKEAERVVSPVVSERRTIYRTGPLRAFLVKVEDRQQFHSSDSQLFEVGDLLDDTGKRPWVLTVGRGRLGKAAHVHFVNNRLAHGSIDGAVALPIVPRGIDDHAAHGGRQVIFRPAGIRALPEGIRITTGVQVDQHLIAIIAVPAPVNIL